jgi:DNA-binding response OmpR family regulator
MRVLVVDDSSMVRDVLRAMIERLGHDVVLAANAAEGLAAERCDLVLLDQQLPDRPGSDVAHDMRARGDTAPLYGISGHPNARQRARDAKLDGCLRKPFKMQDIAALLGVAKAHIEFGDPSLVQTMLNGVIEELPRLVGEAEETEDAETMQRLGHTLRGTLRFVEAPRARRAAEQVEEAAKAGTIDHVALVKLREEVTDLIPRLVELLA